MTRYSRKYGLFIFIALTILLIQFFLAASFYASNQFEEQFLQDGFKQKVQKSDSRRLLRETSSRSHVHDKSINRNELLRGSSDSSIQTTNSPTIGGYKQSISKSNLKLDLTSLGFIPNCTIILRDAIYAINRATTSECKRELSDVACQMQSDKLFPKKLPNFCPYPNVKKKDSVNSYTGTHIKNIRIAFVLTINGRCVRQIFRLLKAIYSPRHIYFIHIDKRQDYLFEELRPLEKLPNVKLARNRLSTIWGGASLLEMLIYSFAQLLDYKGWDYLINLSESDFPIKSLQKLESFLSYNYGHNFVKSHGQDTHRFLVKQGLDKTFHQCDDHMWRLGDRKIPLGIEVDGGSDWIALTRDFCQYIVENDDDLLQGLRIFFKYTLLPAETFFHTVLRNSAFCDTVIDNNLHVTNWRRSQGCKCQYRHIVDWCGCSPNDFKLEDWPRIVDSSEKPLFFARKFEPTVNQEIINRIEVLISKNKLKVAQMSYDKYWQNVYHARWDLHDDAKQSFYFLLSVFSADHIHQLCTGTNPPLRSLTSTIPKQGNVFFKNDTYMGTLITFTNYIDASDDTQFYESYVHPVKNFRVINRQLNPSLRLISAKVCSDYDMKEQIFRNFGCTLNPFSEIGVSHRWSSDSKTNHSVSFVWVDPAEIVAGSFEVQIDWPQTKSNEQTITLYHKPNFNLPLRPGEWTLFIMFKWKMMAEIKFMVLPIIFNAGQLIGESTLTNMNHGPFGGKYLEHNFTAVERLLQLRRDPEHLDIQAEVNSKKIGLEVIEWSLSLLNKYWTVHDFCSEHYEKACYRSNIPMCQSTPWSSYYPDLKSKII